MKKVGTLIAVISAILLIVFAVTPAMADPCETQQIKDGTITDSAGNPITLGYDQFGYNYQAHLFVGTFDSSDRNIDGTYWGFIDYFVDDVLIMKWSDSWLANVDTNCDNQLDMGLVDGVVSGTSKGWETNNIIGDYDSDGDGTQDARYTIFRKIVWVGPGGSIMGQYEVIEEVINDPAGGICGLQYKIAAPGFGLNDQWTVSE